MKYIVCRNFEWLYPDVFEYKTASERAEFSACGGGFASFQIFITRAHTDKLTVTCPGAQIFEELAVPVEENAGIETSLPHFPERKAPFFVYDCLKPCTGIVTPEKGVAALYVAVPVPVGERECRGNVLICDGKEEIFVPYRISVKGVLPEETLKIVMGLSTYNISRCHNGIKGAEYDEMELKYLKMLRRQHQNRLYLYPRLLPDDRIDWEYFDGYVTRALSLGFNAFHLSGVGFRRSWEAEEISVRGFDSRSEEAKTVLRRYLSDIREHLREKGWLNGEMFSIGIADEPNEHNAETYKELAAFVRSVIPEIKLYDAVSSAPIDGSLDIWIPRSDEYENNREVFEKRRSDGGELWQYVCLYPRNGYFNRLMDIPLLSTRYIYWGNYLYDLSGYLHWTVNDYQDNCNPFRISCPKHKNADQVSTLPAGDDKLIYPGEGEPYMSIRLENQRESAEEYEMLKLISQTDRQKADMLCRKAVRSFRDAEYNPCRFADLLEELYTEYEKVCSLEVTV